MTLVTDAISAASNYLSGSAKVPPTTEQIESVHKQLSGWQHEDPPSLTSNLESVLSRYIADQIKPVSDLHYKQFKGIHDASPVTTTYEEIRSTLDPRNASQCKSTTADTQIKWDHLVQHEMNFRGPVEAYKGAQSSLHHLHGYTGTVDLAYSDFAEQLQPEQTSAWLGSLVSLAKSYIETEDSQRVGQKD